jgi:hypothetical protein
MTGVTTLGELASLGADRRPTYVGADLGCLALPVAAPVTDAGGARVGAWTARVEGGRLVVTGGGDRHDWWRAAAAALWAHLDATGAPADPGDAAAPR